MRWGSRVDLQGRKHLMESEGGVERDREKEWAVSKEVKIRDWR